MELKNDKHMQRFSLEAIDFKTLIVYNTSPERESQRMWFIYETVDFDQNARSRGLDFTKGGIMTESGMIEFVNSNPEVFKTPEALKRREYYAAALENGTKPLELISGHRDGPEGVVLLAAVLREDCSYSVQQVSRVFHVAGVHCGLVKSYLMHTGQSMTPSARALKPREGRAATRGRHAVLASTN